MTIPYLVHCQLLNKLISGTTHEVKKYILLHITVLIHKTFNTVSHTASIMLDTKFFFPSPPIITFHIIRMAIKFCMEVCEVS